MATIEYLADHRDAGRTVAEMLRGRFQLTWKQAKQLVEAGHVRIAGTPCSEPGLRIKRGNRVWIRDGVIEKKPGVSIPFMPKPAPIPKELQESLKARAKGKPGDPLTAPAKLDAKKPAPSKSASVVVLPLGLELIYSDDAVVVVNKPAGLTTMRHAEEAAEFGSRGRAYLPKTLQDFLPHLLGDPRAKGFAVHRIDRDTSGLVVFARTPAAAKHLTEQFRKHTVDRRYLALVRGGAPTVARIESVLIADRGDGRRGGFTGKGEAPEEGRRAVTHVATLSAHGFFALVECRLETGRTHQVRIHLGEAGHPLCGERIYDRPKHGGPLPDGSVAKRPLLHAARLGFVHPTTGKMLTWEQQPPADFTDVRKSLLPASMPAVGTA